MFNGRSVAAFLQKKQKAFCQKRPLKMIFLKLNSKIYGFKN